MPCHHCHQNDRQRITSSRCPFNPRHTVRIPQQPQFVFIAPVAIAPVASITIAPSASSTRIQQRIGQLRQFVSIAPTAVAPTTRYIISPAQVTNTEDRRVRRRIDSEAVAPAPEEQPRSISYIVRQILFIV
ncbi:hypothetical protein DFQ28_007908 [Apophysomyces sp. BC1034]|nr:hypothetical protein DFQ28_007908 [Apophysomyces sp. BC1034]